MLTAGFAGVVRPTNRRTNQQAEVRQLHSAATLKPRKELTRMTDPQLDALQYRRPVMRSRCACRIQRNRRR